MSTKETQARLLGSPSGESASIKTSGRVIRPALEIPTALIDEAKAHFHSDGLELTATDPANVGMVDLKVYPEAFDAYAVDADDELMVGFLFEGLTDKLSNARLGKSTDDPVDIDVDETRTVMEIARDYDRSTVRYADEQLNIDPDSIRQEPEIPKLDLPATAEVDVDAFKDAVEHIGTSTDHVVFRADDGSLVLSGGGHEDSPSDYGTAVEFEDVVSLSEEGADPVAKYSLDYLVDMARAVKSSKADNLTVTWGDEYPVFLEFGRSIDEELAYEGEYCLAPRIGGE